ncbi:MAG: TRAP transporter substrate-binding protein DctP [Ottowia sp.]|uniref:TRAP transporter substrate-binding protein DctP n=1 Tax=Ottowia sp. TaxID=1898956 RepID=UPI003C727004
MFKTVAAFAIGMTALIFTASAEQLTYGTYFKATHNIIKDGVKPYLDGVTKNTNGKITFKYLTDGTVVGATTAAKGVQQGLVDMGTVIPLYASSTFPMTSLFSSLPLFQTDSLIETGVINELFYLNCEECQLEWSASKITPLAMYGSSPFYLQCSKEIKGLDDLKGKRIQGTGEYGALATALGGLPMGLTATEFYTGMSQGTLDCIIGTVAWLDTYGLKDVVKYVADLPLGVFRPVSAMNMNARKWNKLSKDERKAFTDGLAKLVADSAYGYIEEDQNARKSGLAAGIKFAPPFEGFTRAFEKVGNEGGQRFVELAKKKGMKEPQRLLGRYLELEKQWREIVAKTKSQADYEVALRDRIFSKVNWAEK